jgi:hypothetical protein
MGRALCSPAGSVLALMIGFVPGDAVQLLARGAWGATRWPHRRGIGRGPLQRQRDQFAVALGRAVKRQILQHPQALGADDLVAFRASCCRRGSMLVVSMPISCTPRSASRSMGASA